MSNSTSILDHPAIRGRYFCPQARCVDDPFMVKVDGAELACYRKLVDPEFFTLVHFHGNGEAVADYVPRLADVIASLGLNSLFVEYRQYGRSTGTAELVSVLGDGESVMQAAGIPPEKAIAFGRSVGSLYAIELVHRQPTIRGLIIESGIADPAEQFLTHADLSLAGVTEDELKTEVGRHFDHRRKLREYQNPLLVLHTENDRLIDVSHAERIHEWAASQQKQLVRFATGDHNTIMSENSDEYLNAVREFVERVTESPDCSSDTVLLHKLKKGDDQAIGELWNRYRKRLMGIARRKLPDGSRREQDEEDILIDTWDSFCRRANAYPKLENSDHMWKLLSRITRRSY